MISGTTSGYHRWLETPFSQHTCQGNFQDKDGYLHGLQLILSFHIVPVLLARVNDWYQRLVC